MGTEIKPKSTFLRNADVIPTTYLGNGGKSVIVRQDETGVDFVDVAQPNVPEPQVNQFFARTTTRSALRANTYNNGTGGVGATITSTANGLISESLYTAGKIGGANVTVAVGDVILVRVESDAKKHGLYEITDLGSVSTPFILTRFAEYDSTSEITTSQVTITEGDNAGSIFVQTTVNPVLGTNNIVYAVSASSTSAAGLSILISTIATTPLPTCTYANGTARASQPGFGARLTATANGVFPTLNGVVPFTGMTILVTGQVDTSKNGDYRVITLGSASTKWVLQRWYSYSTTVSWYQYAEYLINHPSCTLFGKRYTMANTTAIADINIGTPGAGNITYVLNSSSVSSGPFAIADASGTYTYYATLTLAMTAATSGQVIEQFANVIETGNVEITLKNNVTWNGNGYSYTLSRTGTIHALKTTGSVVTNFNFYNTNVIRTGSTDTLFDNAALSLGTSGSGSIRCFGANFTNNGSGVGLVVATSSTAFVQGANAFATTTYGAIGIFTSAGASFAYCTGTGTSGGYGIRCHSGGNTEYCLGISDSGVGFFGDAGTHSFCKGISVSGNGFVSGSSSYSCIGISTSGIGFNATNGFNVDKCTGISTSGVGFFSNIKSYNCTGISSSNKGVQLGSNAIAYNITSKSTTNSSLLAINGCKIIGGTIISEWNNAAGYGIQGNGGVFPAEIRGVKFQLANSSAPYFYNNGTAATVITVDNQYQGGGAYNVNITQGTVSVQDTQGNIFL